MNNPHHASRITHYASRITRETALWAFVALVALALRLSHLDAAPLTASEAHKALLAWRAVTGAGMPEADYSPLLLAANALLFTLCGASDALARLWPALLGSALPLTPLLFRRRIGRLGALLAGLYLAFSPTALVASRRLDGTVIAALGVMLLLGGLLHFLETDNRSWLLLSAGGLALAVTSSPSAYSMLLSLALASLPSALRITHHALRITHYVSRLAPHVPRFILYTLLAVLVLSTGLGWNVAGPGAVGGLPLAWIARFGLSPNPVASPLILLIVYEPVPLLLGLAGLLWAVQRGHRFATLLGLWALFDVLLLTLMPGRTPLDLLGALLPLLMLAARVAEALIQNLRERGDRFSEGIYVPITLILWVHAFLVFTRYAARGASSDLLLLSLVVALQILLGTMFALAVNFDAAWRGAAVGLSLLLLMTTFSAAWGAAYVRPADPRELLSPHPTSPQVHDLVQTLRDLSWRETGLPMTLPFTLQAAPDSVLAWYLRDFSAAERVEHLAAGQTGRVLVTSNRELEQGAGYVGQDFPLRSSWDPAEIHCIWTWPPYCKPLAAWLTLRRSPSLPVTDQWAVLWLQLDMLGNQD